MLSSLITPWNYQTALNKIVALLIAETANQVTIAEGLEYSEDSIESDIIFNIVKGQYFPATNEEAMHMANVYIQKMDVESDDVVAGQHIWNLTIDLYAGSNTYVDSEGTIVRASSAADSRLDYLHDQVSTMLDQQLYYLLKGSVVDSFKRVASNGWMKYVRNPDDDGMSSPIVFGRLQYEMKITQSKTVNEDLITVNDFLFDLKVDEKLAQRILIET